MLHRYRPNSVCVTFASNIYRSVYLSDFFSLLPPSIIWNATLCSVYSRLWDDVQLIAEFRLHIIAILTSCMHAIMAAIHSLRGNYRQEIKCGANV